MSAPSPPFLPENLDAFLKHITANPEQWYNYFSAAHSYGQNNETRLAALNTEIVRKDAVIEYQKEQTERLMAKTPPVLPSDTTSIPSTGTAPPVSSVSTPPVNTPGPSSTVARAPVLSERLPDPDKFDGTRSDLRRFVSQVHEKMGCQL